MRSLRALIIMILCCVSSSGCVFLAAGAAGVGTAKWLSDKATQQVDQPLEKVVDAARKSMADQKLDVYRVTRAKEVTQLLATTVDKKKVWVDVRPLSGKLTQIDVRVGWINGEAEAQRILEAIVNRSKSWLVLP